MKRFFSTIFAGFLFAAGVSSLAAAADVASNSRIDGYTLRAFIDRLDSRPAGLPEQPPVSLPPADVEITVASQEVISDLVDNMGVLPADPYESVRTEILDDFAASVSHSLYYGGFQAAVISDGDLVAYAASEGSSIEDPQRIASVSKIVTSSAIFRLIESGLLSLDTPVAPLLSFETRSSWDNLTVSELLSQRSGIPTNTELWFGGAWGTCSEAAQYALARSPQNRGSFDYSNANSCILSLVIESVTGVPYHEAIEDLVFAPLGMSSPEIDDKYLYLMGAGYWRISALDLGRLMCSLDVNARDSALCVSDFLSDNSKELMQTRTSWSYGLGSWIFNGGAWGHSGTLYHGRNLVISLPDGPIVVLQNQSNIFDSGLAMQSIAASLVSKFGL